MNRQNKVLMITGAVLLAALVMAVMWGAALGGFSKPEPGEGAPMHREHPAPENVSPDIAAQAVLSQGFSWTPAQDDSDLDGFIRSELVTEQLRESLQSAAEVQPPQALPREWEGWARSGDVVRAAVTPDEVNETGGTAEVTAAVSQRVVHPNRETTPLDPFEVSATLVHDADADKWLLDAYEITSAR